MKRLIILTAIFIFYCAAIAQNIQIEQQLRTAQNFERIGNWENAVKIYEELYKKDSLNIVIFDALVRGYDQLKRYDDAIRIIHSQLKFRQKDVGLLSQLGKMYARAGNNDAAIKTWDDALNVDKKNIGAYYTVANIMIESRMIEQAIKVYQKGRTALSDPYVFASDLGYLHSIFMNYADATKEYLLLLKQSQAQLSFVQSRISLYTNKTDGLSAALQIVEKAQKSEPNNTGLIQLLAWLFMEVKQYDKAFSIYKTLDDKTNAQGREIFNFAERASREKAFPTAIRAYTHILNNYSKFQDIPAVKFGFARTLEEASTEEDTLKIFGNIKPFDFQKSPTDGLKFSFSDAINEYNKVVIEFPKTDFAARALFRVAYINFHHLFKIDNALEVLNDIENDYSHFIAATIEARLLAGDVYLTKGELETALEKLKWLANYPGAPPDVRDKARYLIAEINFYQGNFNESSSLLEALSKRPNADVANDAIALNVIINESKDNEKVLNQFAQVMLLKKQRKYEQTAELLIKFINEYPNNSLVENAVVTLGDTYATMHSYGEAINTYEKLLKDFPDNISADKSLLKIGYVYQFGTKDLTKAVSTYQKLLEQYSTSVYSSEARRRIRELRGDSL